jgi:arylsulfatase A-like enzyme
LINHLKEIHQLDNTLVFMMIGDNGASKEGTLNGDIDRFVWQACNRSRRTLTTT